ncbi:hypothetical protein QEP15_13045 [Achromobacter mucicolens]|uniref:DUF2946 family protein n=1 Tax=Achromobacter mucicolens TaxID=1389922 RepID=UPI0024536DB5|nr:DUF2946 family protein [Achromobacter mucicolens]WGJ88306.1 hypothetical protein QEP15_13045 [Achromobacter mucicolens]
MRQRAAQIAGGGPDSGPDPRYHLRRQGDPMYRCATAARRWVSLFAAALFVFQALIASAALAGSGGAGGAGGSPVFGATTIICTASGPRVVTLGQEGAIPGDTPGAYQDATSDAAQHSGAMPHCCVAGCAMLGGASLPALWLLAWLLPSLAQPDAPPATHDPHFSSALARLPQQPRAPPSAA